MKEFFEDFKRHVDLSFPVDIPEDRDIIHHNRECCLAFLRDERDFYIPTYLYLNYL